MKAILSFFAALILLTGYTGLGAQINVGWGSDFKYLKGSEAAGLPENWYKNSYSDDSWRDGASPFWYGDGNGGTELTDMQFTYSTVYFRSVFNAANVDRISQIQLSIDYDDGFVFWINGIEKMRVLAPSVLASDAFASANHESGVSEDFIISLSDGELKDGLNHIAIQALNVSLESSDFHLDLALSASLDLPSLADSVQVIMSHESGFYDTPFNLNLRSDPDTLDIYYTLDGSHPAYSETAIHLGNSGEVLIDPTDISNRAMTPSVVLRTSLKREGFRSSFPQSRTFIFPSYVLTQDYPGGAWPNYNINDQWIDLAMDADISLSATYGGIMDEALKSIPTISIITDIDNLFNESSGIYVNAWGHGEAWERECSMELFNEDSVSFYVNAGLRIRGGWSRHNHFPKHSFRLFFRSEYGDDKLYYPLFQEAGTDQYDKIDLRTSQNYAWSMGDSRNTMLREVFSRDLQRDMGKAHTRSQYYHLYLNGMYWGVYQTQERSEARFAASYFGGDSEDYDVIKVNTENWNYRVEATDGNLAKWEKVYEMCQRGFESLNAYYLVQGLNSTGKPDKELEKLVDVDNLIDYMIGIFYTGNFDAPTSSFMANKKSNNFYAIVDRTDPTQGFHFFNHDAEHSLFSYAAHPGVGIDEDRVNLAERTDDMRMDVAYFDVFHPQWLHHKLCANKEYRLRFSDRAYQLLKKDGILSEDACLERFEKRWDELDPAIVAESARWGDAKTNFAYTRNDHWMSEVDKVRDDFFGMRSGVFIHQLQQADLYPEMEGPDYYIDQRYVVNEVIMIDEDVLLKINKPDLSGELVYTLDGSDPRKEGGEVSKSAIISSSSLNMNISYTTEVKARILEGEVWSAMRKIKILRQDDDYSGIKITEIHYNPLDSIAGTDTIQGKSFEFIEFKNTGDNAVHLGGLEIDSAVSYVFPEHEILHPGRFFVLTSKTVDFFQRYGKYSSGNYKGYLSNEGERVVLLDPKGEELISMRYGITYPWPIYASGLGYSMVSEYASPDGDPAEGLYWIASSEKGGSPFSNDPASNSIFVEEEENVRFGLYPNPTKDFITIRQVEGVVSQFVDAKVLDINGRVIYSFEYKSGERISLRELGLEAGVYLIRLKDGNYISNHKIIFVPD